MLPVCSDEGEEEKEGGEQISPTNHPCHLCMMTMTMLMLMLMLMRVMMLITYSLCVDGVNCKKKCCNKRWTRGDPQTAPVLIIFEIF